MLSFCNVLTVSKAFGSIPDFENLRYQVGVYILVQIVQQRTFLP
jgi:hypothetical protein